MPVAWVVAAIALAGVAFMLRFLKALLREGTPSVYYRIVPVLREPALRRTDTGRGTEKERDLGSLSDIYVDQDSFLTESDRGDYHLELENENRANEYASGLISLDVRPASDSLGWRSIHPRRGYILHERRL
jgi:hypothetical protein